MKPSVPVITVSTTEQPPIRRGALTITPQSQVVDLRLGRKRWRWVRPQALLVQDGDTLERLPIRDRTRALWLLCSSVAIVWLLLGVCARRAPRDKE